MGILGYKETRNLSKGILIISAIAISMFAGGAFLKKILEFNLFGVDFPVMNIIAVSLILVGYWIKTGMLTPPMIPFTKDRGLTKLIYYVLIGAVALGVSSYTPEFLVNILNFELLEYPLLAVRNGVAFVLLASVRVIHING